jgi:hypothetical protein
VHFLSSANQCINRSILNKTVRILEIKMTDISKKEKMHTDPQFKVAEIPSGVGLSF